MIQVPVPTSPTKTILNAVANLLAWPLRNLGKHISLGG